MQLRLLRYVEVVIEGGSRERVGEHDLTPPILDQAGVDGRLEWLQRLVDACDLPHQLQRTLLAQDGGGRRQPAAGRGAISELFEDEREKGGWRRQWVVAGVRDPVPVECLEHRPDVGRVALGMPA